MSNSKFTSLYKNHLIPIKRIEQDILKRKVQEIISDGIGEPTIIYRDCMVSEEEERIIIELSQRALKFCRDYIQSEKKGYGIRYLIFSTYDKNLNQLPEIRVDKNNLSIFTKYNLHNEDIRNN